MFEVSEVLVQVLPAPEGKVIGKATMRLCGGAFVVKGIKILALQKGPYVAMPQRRTEIGEWEDVCFPANKEAREMVKKAVLDAYEAAGGTYPAAPGAEAPANA